MKVFAQRRKNGSQLIDIEDSLFKENDIYFVLKYIYNKT